MSPVEGLHSPRRPVDSTGLSARGFRNTQCHIPGSAHLLLECLTQSTSSTARQCTRGADCEVSLRRACGSCIPPAFLGHSAPGEQPRESITARDSVSSMTDSRHPSRDAVSRTPMVAGWSALSSDAPCCKLRRLGMRNVARFFVEVANRPESVFIL